MKHRLILLPLVMLIIACYPEEEVYFGEQEVEGFSPIYIPAEQAYDIKMQDVQPIERAGKLYLYGDLLLINEIDKGIHLIDNANPADPIKLGFVKVPGSQDMVIKGDIIYANNYGDLVALKITSDHQIQVTERIKEVIQVNNLYPADRGFYFECPDPAKGVVVDWQKKTITNPQCYR